MGHLTFGLKMAAVFSAVALTVLAIGLTASLFGVRWSDGEGPLEVIVGIGFVIAAYGVAGVVGGVAVWALTTLRRTVIGWVLTGMVIAGIAYGAMGVAGAVAYLWLGINLLEFDGPEGVWRQTAIVTFGLAIVAGIPGGLFFWWKEGRGRGAA
jgi:hypothetical protein